MRLRLLLFLFSLNILSLPSLGHAIDKTLTTYHPVTGDVKIPIVWLEDNQSYYFDVHLHYKPTTEEWVLLSYASSSPVLTAAQSNSLSIAEYLLATQSVYIPFACDQGAQKHCYENIVLSELTPFTDDDVHLKLSESQPSSHGLCDPTMNGNWRVSGALTRTENVSNGSTNVQKQFSTSIDESVHLRNIGNRITFKLADVDFTGTCSRTSTEYTSLDMDAQESVKQQQNVYHSKGIKADISGASNARLILENTNSMRQYGHDRITIERPNETRELKFEGDLIFTRE